MILAVGHAPPADLRGAQLVLYRLGQRVAAQGDAHTSGFGDRHRPTEVNYFKLFKQFDLDNDRQISKSEMAEVASPRTSLRAACAQLVSRRCMLEAQGMRSWGILSPLLQPKF